MCTPPNCIVKTSFVGGLKHTRKDEICIKFKSQSVARCSYMLMEITLWKQVKMFKWKKTPGTKSDKLS